MLGCSEDRCTVQCGDRNSNNFCLIFVHYPTIGKEYITPE